MVARIYPRTAHLIVVAPEAGNDCPGAGHTGIALVGIPLLRTGTVEPADYTAEAAAPAAKFLPSSYGGRTGLELVFEMSMD